MNLHIVLRSVGILLLLLACAMAAALALGAVLPAHDARNESLELGGWMAAICITLASSAALLALARWRIPAHGRGETMLRKEAIAIVGIAWIACTLHGALPYLFCKPSPDTSPLAADKALFESVSGLTTTGATVFDEIDSLPRTLLLWRSLTQWLGGIGILAMFVLVLSGTGTSGKKMFGAESSLHSSDLSLANIRQTMRSLWLLYAALTAACALGLWALGLTPFQAINHSMTTTATGGFGTENDSIDSFGALAKVWIIVFMLSCGISFPLYLLLLKRRRFEDLRQHEETWWFLGITATAAVALLIGRAFGGFGDSALDVVFNVVSISTTTGYAVGDYDAWPLAGREVIFVLMVIGGCAGSTAGGLKVSRMLLWVRFCRSELTRAFRPQMVQRPTLNKRPVPEGTLGQLFVVLTAAAFALVAGTLLILLFEPGRSSVSCASAVSSCLLNIGPAFGDFGPTKHFAGLSTPSTLLLPVLMIFGRLEFVAVLVLFSRKLWRRY